MGGEDDIRLVLAERKRLPPARLWLASDLVPARDPRLRVARPRQGVPVDRHQPNRAVLRIRCAGTPLAGRRVDGAAAVRVARDAPELRVADVPLLDAGEARSADVRQLHPELRMSSERGLTVLARREGGTARD